MTLVNKVIHSAKAVNDIELANKASQKAKSSIGCKIAPKNANIIGTTEYQST